MTEFLDRRWVAAAGFMSLALLALVPLLAGALPLGLFLIFLHWPGYMIHQVEEHADDRFRSFVNNRVFKGVEALTTLDVIWINAGCVWGINVASLYLAAFLGIGWGLSAPYMMVVNAVAHIGTSLRTWAYNPGLVTTFLIFLPLGGTTLLLAPGTLFQHCVALGGSLVLHLVIALNAAQRAAASRKSAVAELKRGSHTV